MPTSQIQPLLADGSFGVLHAQTRAYDLFKLPVISTGRPFSFYRRIFFENRAEQNVLAELAGKQVADIGCGLTPFVPDSMFQICNRNGIAFYGVDPKIGSDFRFGAFDTLKVRMTGGRGAIDSDAPYTSERAIGAYANGLPFEDAQLDLILSSWLISVWIKDEPMLGAIFREFDRVLKPGGRIMLYPQPYWRPERFHDPNLVQLAHRYHVSQRFVISPLLVRYPPAYVTTLTKP